MIKTTFKMHYSEAPIAKVTIYGLEDTDRYKFSRRCAIEDVAATTCNGGRYIRPYKNMRGLKLRVEKVKYKCINLGYYVTSATVYVKQED